MNNVRVSARMTRAPTNANLLKARMIEKGDGNFIKCLSFCLNISRPTASGKLQGKIPFTQPEIQLLMIRYDLTAEDVINIFLKGGEENEH